jgi:uncharacterized membrane protein
MTNTSLFRLVLSLSLLSIIIAVIAGVNLSNTLPASLQDYLYQLENEELSNLESILWVLVGLTILVITPLLLIGLWKFKPWARTLFLVLTIVTFPLYVFLGPVVMNPWEAMFNDIAILLEGALIAMMFIGPVSEKFQPVVAVNS